MELKSDRILKVSGTTLAGRYYPEGIVKPDVPDNDQHRKELIRNHTCAYLDDLSLTPKPASQYKSSDLRIVSDPSPHYFNSFVPPKIVMIGEGPGYTETRTQTPFTGLVQLADSACLTCKHLLKHYGFFFGVSKTYDDGPCCYEQVSDINANLPYFGASIYGYTSPQTIFKTAGELLNRMLKSAGYPRHPRMRLPYYITNAVEYRCLTDDDKNRTPHQDELDEQRPMLLAKLISINPKAIMLMGNVAGLALGFKQSLLKIRSLEEQIQQIPLDYISVEFTDTDTGEISYPLANVPVYGFYHPSYLMKMHDMNKEEAAKVIQSTINLLSKIITNYALFSN